MLVADVDRAVAVLCDARRLQQRLVERQVRTAGLLVERLAIERVLARAERRGDRVASDVQTAACDHNLLLALRGRLRGSRCRGTGRRTRLLDAFLCEGRSRYDQGR